MDALQEVLGLELVLLDPAVRAVPEQVRELLHADFVEYGASGRVWDRESTIAALATDPGLASVAASVEDMQAVLLADGLVQVRYRLTGSRPSLRSSIWMWDSVAWRLWFHQGTLV